MAETYSATDWTPCPSSCGWTDIKSRTLTVDIGLTNNLTTSDLGSMDNITTTTTNGSINYNVSTETQFAFCKLNPCDGKWQHFDAFKTVFETSFKDMFSQIWSIIQWKTLNIVTENIIIELMWSNWPTILMQWNICYLRSISFDNAICWARLL